MFLVVTDNAEEFSRLKLTLGRGLKQVRDRSELSEVLETDSGNTFHLVLIGSNCELANALAISEELRVTHPTIGIVLLRKKVDTQMTTQAMAAGIREVVLSNEPEGIVLACKRSEEISRRQMQNSTHELNQKVLGKVIAVHAARDGLGVTSTAISIATDLVRRKSLRVCLVDASPYMGDIAIRFRVETNRSWEELLKLRELDDEALKSTIHISNSQVELLLAPRDLTREEIDGTFFTNQIIRPLQRLYDFVVIDTESRLTGLTKAIFGVTNRIVLLTDLDLASLKNLKKRLKELDAMELNPNLISIIVNKSNLHVGLDPDDVAELIGLSIDAFLPWDSDLTRFSNEGLSLVSEKAKSALSHEIQHANDLLIEKVNSSTLIKNKVRGRRSA